MKKIFLVFCVLIFGCNLAFAQYKPIPQKLSKQYQKEVTQIINKKYPQTKNKILQVANNAEKMYRKVLKNKNLYMEFCTKQFDMQIDAPEFYLYSDLIKITKKYVTLSDKDIPATDSSGILYQFLLPYLKDNNVNIQKLKDLEQISGKEYKQIEKYYQNAHNLVYPNENY